MKSLKALNNPLSTGQKQLDLLHKGTSETYKPPLFVDTIEPTGHFPMKAKGVEVLQINMGKMCNQVCKHCHVDAGPDRQEIMTRATLELCLNVLKNESITTVDLTGGAPEMNPEFRWFVTEASALGKHIIVRCNLTILLANKKYNDLPQFFKQHKVEVVSSLPHFSARRTDAQRGEGVFEKSIKALQMLNAVGYGSGDLLLNLVYNPSGAFLPPAQASLERDFKKKLKDQYGIEFGQLFAITNMPISRYLDYLVASGQYEDYMTQLVDAYNPMAVEHVMCRTTLSVGWDGQLYDCDFNQMLEINCSGTKNKHIADFDLEALENRNILLDQHCYGCTAGAGSSCGGEVV